MRYNYCMSTIEDAYEQYNQALQHLPDNQLTEAQQAITRAIELAEPLFEGAESSEATDSLAQLKKALAGTEQAQQTTSQLRERITAMQQRLGIASVGQHIESSPGNVLYDPGEGFTPIDYDDSATNRTPDASEKSNEPNRKESNEAADANPDAPKWYHKRIDEEDPLRVRYDTRFRELAKDANLITYTGPMANAKVFEIGEGDIHKVYLTEDNQYVIKVPQPNPDGEPYPPELIAQDIREKVAALRIGKGQPGLEQIVACSDDPYAPGIVCEFVDGKDSHWVTSQEVNAMTDQQLEDLAGTLEFMQDNRLNIDPIRREHIKFDKDKGVTIMDYVLQDVEDAMEEDESIKSPPQTINDRITTVMNKTTLLRLCDRVNGLPPVAVRFRDICQRRFGQAAADALTRQWQEDGFIS